MIERHLNDIFKFFDICVSLVGEFENIDKERDALAYSVYEEKIKTKVVHPFTKEYTKLQQGLISDITIIDDTLSVNTNKILTNFQDGFLEKIQSRQADYNYIKSYIKGVQQELISSIKDYNFKIID